MRQFPASKWKMDPVDLYDCRLRSWFMEAATSPKDVIILLDSSGSMTGQRLDIAKHVVNTILDTLGTNDFVNIFTFSDKVKPVVGCFEDTLVQVYIHILFNIHYIPYILLSFLPPSHSLSTYLSLSVLSIYRCRPITGNRNECLQKIGVQR